MSDTTTILDRRARKTVGVMASARASHREARLGVRRHLKRWAAYTDDRLKANHPSRVVWDRERFLLELHADAPGLSAAQLVAVVDAFDAAVKRATIPAFGVMPALVVPGRVGQLVRRVDVGAVLGMK